MILYSRVYWVNGVATIATMAEGQGKFCYFTVDLRQLCDHDRATPDNNYTCIVSSVAAKFWADLQAKLNMIDK